MDRLDAGLTRIGFWPLWLGAWAANIVLVWTDAYRHQATYGLLLPLASVPAVLGFRAMVLRAGPRKGPRRLVTRLFTRPTWRPVLMAAYGVLAATTSLKRDDAAGWFAVLTGGVAAATLTIATRPLHYVASEPPTAPPAPTSARL
ncbi:MAG: hypothetical protein QOE45_557 [Frankiaceae bacterium]|nr:hypothetical protein [Frankiaceae bacterium]